MGAPVDIFEPDWIVTNEDGTERELIVEAKLRPISLAQTESQLKRYMMEINYPLGVLATPETIRLYQNECLSDTEDSVKLVGECPAPADWATWRDLGSPEHAVPGYDGAVRRYGDTYAYDWRKRETLVEAAFVDAVRDWLKRLTTEEGLRALPPDFRREAEYYLFPVLFRGELRAAGPRKGYGVSYGQGYGSS